MHCTLFSVNVKCRDSIVFKVITIVHIRGGTVPHSVQFLKGKTWLSDGHRRNKYNSQNKTVSLYQCRLLLRIISV